MTQNNPTNKTLTALFLKNRYASDKYKLGYLDNFYDQILPPLIDRCENVLEIGCLHGGSINMWRDYFPERVDIYGADINEFSCNERVVKKIGDAYSDEFVDGFRNDFFDVIIDDGPHTYQSFVDLIKKYHSKLKSDGILIIEDIIRPLCGMGVTAEQQASLIKLAKEVGYSSVREFNMTGKQKNLSLLWKWKSGLYILLLKK